MLKRTLLFCTCLLIVVLSGCTKSDPSVVVNGDSSATAGDDSSLNSFASNALQCEEKYLESKSDEYLKILCDQLRVLPWKEEQLRKLVLEYYPVFFEKFDEDQIKDISEYGFDPFYQEYVFAYKAEGIGGLIPVYNEYKEKASNVYIYARYIYSNVLGLDNISAEEYDYFYNEALALYWTARGDVKTYTTADENRDAFLKVLNAFGCVNDICEAMGKEIDSAVKEDMEEYSESYKEIMDSFL